MGTADQVLRYRRRAVVRWAPAVLGVVATLLLVASATVTGEVSALPVTIATCLVTAAAFAVLIATEGVTISPAALVISSPRGRRTIPWPDIEAIQARGTRLWVMTAAGWYALPLGASSPARSTSVPSESAGGALGTETWAAWIERRGPGWRAEGLAPWTPTMDLRGRVVLRPPVVSRIVVAAGVVASLASTAVGVAVGELISHIQRPSASTTEPSDSWALLWFNLLVLVTTVAVTGAVHRWTRVAIDDETVHIRTVGRSLRIPRASIIGVREVGRGFGLDQRLVIDHGANGPDGRWFGRSTTMPGPASSTRTTLNDPEFYAKWAWLHDQLAVTPEPAPSMIDHTAS